MMPLLGHMMVILLGNTIVVEQGLCSKLTYCEAGMGYLSHKVFVE